MGSTGVGYVDRSSFPLVARDCYDDSLRIANDDGSRNNRWATGNLQRACKAKTSETLSIGNQQGQKVIQVLHTKYNRLQNRYLYVT